MVLSSGFPGLALLGGLLAALGATAARAAGPPAPELRVYTSGSYMPLHGTNGAARIGIEPEIASLLARELGRRLVFVDRSAIGLDSLAAVATGKADVALNAITPTGERAKLVDFTRPFATLELRLAAARDVHVSASNDLAGKKIAVPRGAAADEARAAALPGTLVLVPSLADAVAAVAWGEADLALGEDAGLLDLVRGTSVRIVGPVIAPSPVTMAVPKGRAAEYDALLATLEPRIAAVRARWRHYYARFRTLDCRYENACGLLDDGEIACLAKRSPASSPPPGRFFAVSAGDAHACAIRADGRLACWGDPAMPMSPPEGAFSSVSVGRSHACALRKGDGSIACWGSNGKRESSPPAGAFSDVAAGDELSCAIRRSDGGLACWGRLSGGFTGSFKQVSAAKGICAIRSDAKVVCAGLALGGGRTFEDASDDRYRAVSVGREAALGLLESGKVKPIEGWPSPPQVQLESVSARCGVTADGTPIWFAGGSGEMGSPSQYEARVAGEQVLIADARSTRGGPPSARIGIAYCDVETSVGGETLGNGLWTLAGAVDPAFGLLRPTDDESTVLHGARWFVADAGKGTPPHAVLGTPCHGFALAATVPLRPAHAPKGSGKIEIHVGKRTAGTWALLARGSERRVLGLIEETYDPRKFGIRPEDHPAPDEHLEIGSGALRPNICRALVLRDESAEGGDGADDVAEGELLILPEDCNEGD